MSLVKWDPFRELGTLRGELNRIFAGSNGETMGLFESWTPSVNIAENDKEIRIKVELPEVDKKDIDVGIDGDVLTVSGERRMEKEEKKEDYTRLERGYGSFSRSFTLPKNVDRENIKAESRNGVLKLTLPKTKSAKSNRKEIAVA